MLRTCVFLGFWGGAAAAAQPLAQVSSDLSTFDKSCDGREFGVKDEAALIRFDSELKSALLASDPFRLSVLVRYPLRVSGPGRGSIAISDPQALQERFDEIFPEYVKTAVLRTLRSDVGCSYTGVMYGNGEIWVTPDVADGALEYRIDSVNLSPKSPNSTPLGHRLLDFVCDTSKHRILIDSDKQIQYRYRAWNKPKAISEPPDMEIDAGKLEMVGTGPCVHDEWKFTKGKTTFTVGKLGCTDGSEPTGTRGFLTVEIDGAVKQELFCK